MLQPGRFGPFLLFRETGSNRIRSCHRAGITRGRAVERIVRLEVFDRPGFEPAELLSRLEAAQRVQASLHDPHIAAGAGVGEVEGTPYAAYDFELGTTLAAFLRAARERSFPIPLDQALFIAERIALGLAAAYRRESDGEPCLHAFLTPDAVLLSNVGEVKVSGFETAPFLRRSLCGEPPCAPYLSPQCRAGQAPHPLDDVYSLGSLLFELVTGNPLTPDAPLERLTVRSTGEAAPKALRELLERSLADPAQRIPDVLSWQQSLGRLILDGEYNPTTFNLAFLLHTLLREPLERGVDELEREKRFVLPQAEPPSGAVQPPAPPETSASGSTDTLQETATDASRDASTGTSPPAAPEAPAPDRRPFWLGFSISAVAASALLGGLLLWRASASGPAPDRLELAAVPSPAKAAPSIAQRGEPALGAAGSAPGVAPMLQLSEVVEGQLGAPLDNDEIERALAERAAEIERNLAAQYEEKLEALRSEMIALRALEERAPDPPPEPSGASEIADSGSRVASEVVARGSDEAIETRTPEPADPPAVSALEAAAPVIAGPAGDPGPDGAPRSGEPAEAEDIDADQGEPQDRLFKPLLVPETAPEPASPPLAGGPSPVVDEPAAAEATSDAPPAETRARLLRLKPPVYPPAAKRLGLSATARVQVVISPEGDVLDAEIVGPALGSGFDRAALIAVKRSKWEPARRAGNPVESTGMVTLQFQP